MSRPIVYFTKTITPAKILEIYKKIGKELEGPVAVKVHSGEDGNQNFLGPDLFKDVVEYVKGTIVENNVAYPGARDTTEHHIELMKKHKWSEYFEVDILDEDPNIETDLELEIPDGFKIKKNYVGGHAAKYKSMLVLSHFKGHPMGGYGAALKQLSIGMGSTHGKSYQHSAGVTTDPAEVWQKKAKQEDFLDSMSDAATSVVRYFNSEGKGGLVYINTIKNVSRDCDCMAKAEDPCMGDIGICGSLDPVACDQACMDMILNSADKGKQKLIDRIIELHGYRTIKRSEEHGIGMRDYQLVSID